MTTRTLKLAANGRGEFFVHIYCADGSVCSEGPFATGEEAAKALQEIESGIYWLGRYNSEEDE